MVRISGKTAIFELRLGIWTHLSRLLGISSPVEAEENPVILVMVHGAQLYLDKNHPLPRYVNNHPFYDSALPSLASCLQKLKGAPISVFDVGANVGDTAAIIAAAVAPQNVRFICIEADSAYLPLLRQNTESLNVKIVQAIAGANPGVTHHQAVNNGHGTSAIQLSASLTQIVTLDDVANGELFDLIKVDTDGYEVEVLAGAHQTLMHKTVSVFLEYSPRHLRRYGKVEPNTMLEIMATAGFENTIVYDNCGYLVGMFPTLGNELCSLTEYAACRPGIYYDLLFHRDVDFMRAFYRSERDRMKNNANELDGFPISIRGGSQQE